jgi:hypothetical protein
MDLFLNLKRNLRTLIRQKAIQNAAHTYGDVNVTHSIIFLVPRTVFDISKQNGHNVPEL